MYYNCRIDAYIYSEWCLSLTMAFIYLYGSLRLPHIERPDLESDPFISALADFGHCPEMLAALAIPYRSSKVIIRSSDIRAVRRMRQKFPIEDMRHWISLAFADSSKQICSTALPCRNITVAPCDNPKSLPPFNLVAPTNKMVYPTVSYILSWPMSSS